MKEFVAMDLSARKILQEEIQRKLDALQGIVPPVEEEVVVPTKMETYTSTLSKMDKVVTEDANLLGGGEGVEVTRAEFQSLKTSLASLGGGGIGESGVTQVLINNFGLTPLPLDSNGQPEEPPNETKARFATGTTPTLRNSDGIASVSALGSGQTIRYEVTFSTPYTSADAYITMLTVDQEGTDRTTTLIPPVSATSRVPVVIQQNAASVIVAVENAETADNVDDVTINLRTFEF